MSDEENTNPWEQLRKTAQKISKNTSAASNPGIVFASDDDDYKNYAEVPILRKYNYRLETGNVGTDNDNIANILYNINRMEMDVDYMFSDLEELKEDLSDFSSMVFESLVHLITFISDYENKLKKETLDIVLAAFREAKADVDSAMNDVNAENPDTEKICSVFTTVYRRFLEIVPSILALDDQAIGRI